MAHWLLDSAGRAAHMDSWLAVRCLAALLTAFLIASVGGRAIIACLRRNSIGERTDRTPIEDKALRAQINAKAGTPTMGGLIILAGLLPAALLWGDLRNAYLWLALACFISLGALGMADDWLKLTGRGHRGRGLKVRHKLLVQGAIGCALGALWLANGPDVPGTWASCPPFSIPMLGFLAILWVALVVATMSNAVNVTDGLDGLAGGLSLAALGALGLLASHARNQALGPELAELSVFCAALGGGVLGFLWHNWHPARVFMGDTGSLALGGSIGLVAVMTRSELLLPLIALVFLAEFGSSVLQVLWFKATGRRILPIAPLHYIWQGKGVPETRIVARLYTVGFLAAAPVLLFL